MRGKQAGQKLWQAFGCVTCLVLTSMFSNQLGDSEFSGGRITGPVLSIFDTGILLFLVALLLTSFYVRIAAIIGLAASLLCLPLYFYFVAPGPFGLVFKGEYSTPQLTNTVLDGSAIAGVVALAATMVICLHNFWSSNREDRRSPKSAIP